MDFLTEWHRWRTLNFMSVLAKAASIGLPQLEGPRRIVRFKNRGASLGLGASDTPGLIRKIEVGFSFLALEKLESHTGVGLSMLGSIIGIPERTLARRKVAGKLAPEESERLLRISSIFEKSVELFEGDIEAAVNWLTTPKKALGNQQPLSYSRTELGAREVENLLGRIEHGVFS
jgi:putative toxin-antitoxin system antitoxin component (TIGR02293 family)